MSPYPTTSSPPWSYAPCIFMDKGFQTIASNWMSHLKPCNQAILKTLLNSITLYTLGNHLFPLKELFLGPLCTCLGRMIELAHKNVIKVSH